MLERAVRLQWSTPASPGGASITYLVQQLAGTTWSTIGTTVGNTLTVTGLYGGQPYRFRVAARNTAGTGPALDFGTVTLPAQPALTVRDPAPGNGHIVVSWGIRPTPSPTLGRPTSIRIERLTTGQAAWTLAGTTTLATGVFTLTGLTNGRQYWIRVGAVYSNGDISWSRTVTTVPRTVPTAPLKPAVVAGNSAIGAQWALPTSNGGAPVTGFRIQLSLNGRTWRDYTPTGAPWNPANPPVHTSTGIVLRPTGWLAPYVVPGRALWLRVAAVNAAGTGPFTLLGSAVPYTYPGAPRQLRATPGAGSMSLSWLAPTFTGHRPLGPYTIELSMWGTTSPWRTFGRTTTTSFRLTGLVANRHYCLRVIAWNTGGAGATTVPFAFWGGTWWGLDPSGRGCPA
jgi:titin